MDTADDLVGAIRAELRALADPALAPGQQAYMKSETPFLGVRVPAVRALARRLGRDVRDPVALRDAARTTPDRVRAFVDAHPELSPLSRREALKHLG